MRDVRRMADGESFEKCRSVGVLDLPDEMLCNIFRYLAHPIFQMDDNQQYYDFQPWCAEKNIQNIRLTCRRFWAASSHLLVHTLSVSLTEDSLARAADIAACPVVGRGVHDVCVDLRTWSPHLRRRPSLDISGIRAADEVWKRLSMAVDRKGSQCAYTLQSLGDESNGGREGVSLNWGEDGDGGGTSGGYANLDAAGESHKGIGDEEDPERWASDFSDADAHDAIDARLDSRGTIKPNWHTPLTTRAAIRRILRNCRAVNKICGQYRQHRYEVYGSGVESEWHPTPANETEALVIDAIKAATTKARQRAAEQESMVETGSFVRRLAAITRSLPLARRLMITDIRPAYEDVRINELVNSIDTGPDSIRELVEGAAVQSCEWFWLAMDNRANDIHKLLTQLLPQILCAFGAATVELKGLDICLSVPPTLSLEWEQQRDDPSSVSFWPLPDAPPTSPHSKDKLDTRENSNAIWVYHNTWQEAVAAATRSLVFFSFKLHNENPYSPIVIEEEGLPWRILRSPGELRSVLELVRSCTHSRTGSSTQTSQHLRRLSLDFSFMCYFRGRISLMDWEGDFLDDDVDFEACQMIASNALTVAPLVDNLLAALPRKDTDPPLWPALRSVELLKVPVDDVALIEFVRSAGGATGKKLRLSTDGLWLMGARNAWADVLDVLREHVDPQHTSQKRPGGSAMMRLSKSTWRRVFMEPNLDYDKTPAADYVPGGY